MRKLAVFQPSKTPADHPFVQKVAAAIEAYGETPVIYPNLGGSVPDDIFTRELGIPSIWLPFANADTNSHAPDENLRLDLFHRSAEIAAAVIEGLAR